MEVYLDWRSCIANGTGRFFFWRRRRRQKKLELQRAEELTAATQIVVPEIEYVGFDEGQQPDQSEPKS